MPHTIIFSTDYWGIRPDHRHVMHEMKSKECLTPESLKEECGDCGKMLSVTEISSPKLRGITMRATLQPNEWGSKERSETTDIFSMD